MASEDGILGYPNYKKAFDLTTNASAYDIGAILCQEDRPIKMVSRALKDSEINYSTNERELLTIVWVMAKLQYYLYGVNDIYLH